jgi:hypothetical protein
MKNAKYVNEPLQAYIIPSGDAHQVCLIRSDKYSDKTVYRNLLGSEKGEDKTGYHN